MKQVTRHQPKFRMERKILVCHEKSLFCRDVARVSDGSVLTYKYIFRYRTSVWPSAIISPTLSSTGNTLTLLPVLHLSQNIRWLKLRFFACSFGKIRCCLWMCFLRLTITWINNKLLNQLQCVARLHWTLRLASTFPRKSQNPATVKWENQWRWWKKLFCNICFRNQRTTWNQSNTSTKF